MNIIQRAGLAFGLIERADDATTPAGVMPPARAAAEAEITADTALTISSVFRAVGIHVTAASQLAIDVEKAGVALPSTPALVAQPDVEISRSAWIEQNVMSLYLTGNAFWHLVRDPAGQVINARVLDPHKVTVVKNLDRRTAPDNEKFSYYLNAERIPAKDIKHLAFLRVPGHRSGLGPIQAARTELAGVKDTRDYASQWFRDSGQAAAALFSDKPLTKKQADEAREQWYQHPAGTTRVIGGGFKYESYALNPADAQWLESQRFDVTRVARLMGAPASLMLASVEGGSQTYQNVEQDWIGYVRFSLMKPLREIEEGLSAISPRGQIARFVIETLLRTDTKTRYEAYEVGLRAGFLLPSEVRKTEHLPAVDGIDDKQPAPATAPAQPAPALEAAQ